MKRSFLPVAAIVGLLVAHAAFSLSAMHGASVTFDENLHIAAGLSYWKFDDYRLQPENGNLPQRWCALPLAATGCVFPPDSDLWRSSDSYGIGQQLLYGGANDPARVLFAARAMSVVWSTSLCLVVFLWSRSLFGLAGGLVSLVLAAFWPAVVAHGALATSDVCGALFFTLAAWCLWDMLREATLATLARACGAVGLAAIAKHSSVLLAPVAVLLLVIRLLDGRPLPVRFTAGDRVVTTRAAKLGLGLGLLVAPLLAAALCIWAACGFRYAAMNPHMEPGKLYLFPTLEVSTLCAGGIGRLCRIFGDSRLLPEAWLFGMSAVVACSGYRYAFAMGEHSLQGWWWFFPLCLAIKNTLPSLALSLWGLVTFAHTTFEACRRRLPLDAATYGSIPLVVTLAVLWPTFLTSHLNIGERHLLPSYPPLMILAGGLWRAAGPAWPRVVIAALLALHAADVTSRWPSTLAYFNQIVPRDTEYRWLVDSSLDWGQDLDRLATWLERNRRPGEPVFTTLFGGAPVTAVRLDCEQLGFTRRRLAPGLYCISATALQGMSDVIKGPWSRTHETMWQTSRQFMARHENSPDEAAAAALITNLTVDRDEAHVRAIRGVATVHDRAVAASTILQAGRLKAFLRQRPPDASIGGSILIWRLSQADLFAALEGPPAELADQSWFEREGYGTAAELIALGRGRLQAGDAEAARVIFGRMLVFYPIDPRAWAGLSLACKAAGLPEEAERARREGERLIQLHERSGAGP